MRADLNRQMPFCLWPDSQRWTSPVNKRVDALKHEAGFTIIEVMVAIFILLLGVLATTTLLNTANAETERNQSRNGATNLVRDIIEASRALPYDQVNPTVNVANAADNTIVAALQGMSPTTGGSSFADSDASQSGWQITRRGVEYTVTVLSCVVDDAKDKTVGTHSPVHADGSGYYCPALPTSPTGDGNGDDYRRVSVTASWNSNSCNSCSSPGQPNSAKTFSVAQTGVIVNPTGGLGPPPIGPPTYSNSTNCHTTTISQSFPARATGALFTVSDPAGTQFSATTPVVDGATGNKTFSFTYNLSPPDNTYQVDISAFDSSGHFGPPAVAFLYINCDQPAPVGSVTGGFNWRRCTQYPVACAPGDRVFDLDWTPSADQDVVGYYVWRVNGTGPDYANVAGDTADTRVACISRSATPPTTTIPGPLDFLEPFQPACWDAGLPSAPSLPAVVTGLSFDGTQESYWVQAVDYQETGDPSIPPTTLRTPTSVSHPLTNHPATLLTVTENMLNVRPTPPVLSVSNANGQPCLSWTNSTDVDVLGGNLTSPVRYYRI